MDKKFILSFIVIFVVSMILGFITHGWALSDEYQATGLMRPEAEAEGFIGWMLLAHAIIAFAFVAIYRRGHEAKPWLAQGVRFGLLMALFGAVGIYLIYYAVQPVPGMLVFRQAVYDTINFMILGVLVAWMYRTN